MTYEQNTAFTRRIVTVRDFAAIGIDEVLALDDAGPSEMKLHRHIDDDDAFGKATRETHLVEHLMAMDEIVARTGRSSAERLMGYWDHAMAVTRQVLHA